MEIEKVVVPDQHRFIGDIPTLNNETHAHDIKRMGEMFELNFLTHFPKNKDLKYLDFGCGYGTLLSYLLSRGYRNLFGFDPDFRCAKGARDHLGNSATIFCEDDILEFLDRNKGKFDVISTISVVPYFPRADVVKYFKALADCLVPGGRLFIEVPNAAGIFGQIEFIQDPYMGSVYTDVLLSDLMKKAELKIEVLGGMRIAKGGMKRRVWMAARMIWVKVLKIISILERGNHDRMPKCFDQRLVVVAVKQN